MKRRKAIAAVLAAVLSLVSASAAYAKELSEQEMTKREAAEVLEQEPTEQETAEPPQEDAAEQLSYGKVVNAAEEAESLEGEYIPVLMYHHFAIRNMGVGNGVVTTTKELEDHLHYFQSQGYRIISLEELDSLLTATEKDTHAESDWYPEIHMESGGNDGKIGLYEGLQPYGRPSACCGRGGRGVP